MGRLLGLIILVIDVFIVVDIIFISKKDIEKKILWVIAVVFLPILGPVLYYIIGKSK